MNHPTETEWIAYREGEPNQREAFAAHLRECAECREELHRIETVYAAMNAMPVPDPGDDYERRVWQQLAPQLRERPGRWWQGIFQTRRFVLVGAVAALVVLAFLLGKRSGHKSTENEMADAGKIGERVLLVAVGDHLGRSEMILVELANTEPQKGRKFVDISSEQKRAEDLVEQNRLYRQTAVRDGDIAMAETLDELERVLLDVANSPAEITPEQFESLQKRIESRGILFKVRVVHQGVQEKEKSTTTPPEQQNSGSSERNKA
jgi:hypothetical protein